MQMEAISMAINSSLSLVQRTLRGAAAMTLLAGSDTTQGTVVSTLCRTPFNFAI